jgi:deoxyribodipyrimidine photo-lyase
MKGIVDPRRIRQLNTAIWKSGRVAYWMGRDQRVANNWALLAAADLAHRYNEELVVYFVLPTTFLHATRRQYDFLLKGLAQVEKELEKRGIRFVTEAGNVEQKLRAFIAEYQIGALVTDHNPVSNVMSWKQRVADELTIPCYEVDAHNIVPVWVASQKREWAAYTIRPKINRLLPEFLKDFPDIPVTKPLSSTSRRTNWSSLAKAITVREDVAPVTWCMPGELEAEKATQAFVSTKLAGYAENRNNPSLFGQSDLSPYLHFGHLSAQALALQVERSDAPTVDKQAFLEELVIRRELSDNFCFYTPNYTTLSAAPPWAQESLAQHVTNKRQFTYTFEEFERGETHDVLWNAAQKELRLHGKLHGYLRMLWAKKILEWSKTPEEALAIAIALNDTYSLDGCDPNGYAGVLWSIAGLHDRPWFEREVYGKVRYMSSEATARKFNLRAYLQYVENLV